MLEPCVAAHQAPLGQCPQPRAKRGRNTAGPALGTWKGNVGEERKNPSKAVNKMGETFTCSAALGARLGLKPPSGPQPLSAKP